MIFMNNSWIITLKKWQKNKNLVDMKLKNLLKKIYKNIYVELYAIYLRIKLLVQKLESINVKIKMLRMIFSAHKMNIYYNRVQCIEWGINIFFNIKHYKNFYLHKIFLKCWKTVKSYQEVKSLLPKFFSIYKMKKQKKMKENKCLMIKVQKNK